jgi:hypothetical protein
MVDKHRRLFLVFFGVCLALATLEVAVRASSAHQRRMWSRDDRLTMCQTDPRRIWRYRPNFSQQYATSVFSMEVSTNSLGLRDSEQRNAPVLAIGDSFTFGWGVAASERFTSHLEKQLGLPVINAGHRMYTFDQQFLTLRELVDTVLPSVVIQGFYAPHVATIASHQWHKRRGELEAISDDSVSVDVDGALRFSSTWISEPPLHLQSAAFVARTILNKGLLEHVARDFHALLSDEASLDDAWDMTAEAARETAAFLHNRGIAYLPFVIPWREPAAAVPDERLLRTIETATGVAPIDMETAFRTDPRLRLYFAIDPHWTERGHAVAAEALTPHVQAALHPRRG